MNKLLWGTFLFCLLLSPVTVFGDDTEWENFDEESDLVEREILGTTGDVPSTTTSGGSDTTGTGGTGTSGTTGTTGYVGTTGSASTTGSSGGEVVKKPLDPTKNTTIDLPSGSTNGTAAITFPPFADGVIATVAVASPAIPDYQDPAGSSKPTNGNYKGLSFFVNLEYPNGTAITTLDSPIVFLLQVQNPSDNDALMYFDIANSVWVSAADSCATPVDISLPGGFREVHVCHLTQFAVFEVTPDGPSSTSAGEVPLPEVTETDDSGLIAAVIIIPIVIVGVIISLVAWTLLRNPEGKGDDEEKGGVELESPKSRATELTKGAAESDSDSDSESDSDKAESSSTSESESRQGGEAKKPASSSDDTSTSSSEDDDKDSTGSSTDDSTSSSDD